MPEGQGLQQTASPLSRDETRSVNICLRANRLSKIKGGTNAGPNLLRQGEPGTPQYHVYVYYLYMFYELLQKGNQNFWNLSRPGPTTEKST